MSQFTHRFGRLSLTDGASTSMSSQAKRYASVNIPYHPISAIDSMEPPIHLATRDPYGKNEQSFKSFKTLLGNCRTFKDLANAVDFNVTTRTWAYIHRCLNALAKATGRTEKFIGLKDFIAWCCNISRLPKELQIMIMQELGPLHIALLEVVFPDLRQLVATYRCAIYGAQWDRFDLVGSLYNVKQLTSPRADADCRMRPDDCDRIYCEAAKLQDDALIAANYLRSTLWAGAHPEDVPTFAELCDTMLVLAPVMKGWRERNDAGWEAVARAPSSMCDTVFKCLFQIGEGALRGQKLPLPANAPYRYKREIDDFGKIAILVATFSVLDDLAILFDALDKRNFTEGPNLERLMRDTMIEDPEVFQQRICCSKFVYHRGLPRARILHMHASGIDVDFGGTHGNGDISVYLNDTVFAEPHCAERLFVKLGRALDVGAEFDSEEYDRVIWPTMNRGHWRMQERLPTWHWMYWCDPVVGLAQMFDLDAACMEV